MRVVVLGATGRTGRAVVERLLVAGDHPIAVARSPLPGGFPSAVTVVRADLASGDPGLQQALPGADAVVSVLGHRGKADDGVLESGARATIAAMHGTGVDRLLAVSAAPVTTVASPGNPHPPRRDPGDDVLTALLLTPIVHRAFGSVYADSARMEDAIRASGLRWTIARPPRLVNGPATGRIRTAVDRNVRGGRSVRRSDLAAWLVEAIRDPSTEGHGIGIAR
jgi:uncharacterized protein YbjT (DUF2867 family)